MIDRKSLLLVAASAAATLFVCEAALRVIERDPAPAPSQASSPNQDAQQKLVVRQAADCAKSFELDQYNKGFPNYLPMWTGDYFFLLNNLVKRDFQVRYRNMSLGIFWSLLNPLVTTAVLTFVFTKISIFSSPKPHYPVFVLCGLVPFNFFTMAMSTSTSSLIDNGRIIKRLPIPREIIPISTVLGNCVHLLIQIGLLLAFAVGFGLGVNRYWLWLPVLWFLQVGFVCGLSLITAALNVYVRDTRYVVESANTVLFWLVPIFYGIEMVPAVFEPLYAFNPVAALVVALRSILLDGVAPRFTIVWKLALVSTVMMSVGLLAFRKLKQGFYDYL